MFGAGAWNCRLTWSSGHGAALSLIVVRTGLPRIDALQAHGSHQPRHRAAGNLDALALQLPPDLAHAIDPEVLLEHAPNLGLQGGVPLRPRRQPGGIGPLGGMGVVGRRGDRQHLADRLDPIRLAVIVDEGDHGLNRRSSSAWAKYADALRRISLACRSSRFSRSSAFSFVGHIRRHASPHAAVALGLLHPLIQRLRRAADLGRDRDDRRPARRHARFVIQHHPHRAGADLRRKLVRRLACHGSTFSRVGASGKPGAVHKMLSSKASTAACVTSC